MRQSIRIGRFAGVDVGVNWSVLLIFGLVTWELAEIVLPDTYGGGATVGYWVAAGLAAVAFFASLLAHEVSHAVVARHHGVGVHSITLWLFGGVAQLEGEAHSSGADFRIAAVGPATSVALAAGFAGVQLALSGLGAHGLAVVVLTWLWEINLLLAGFNLIPAAPLDGGRILRAALWHRWHDRRRAAVSAARAGRGFGIVLIVIGALEIATGDLLGLWPALLGMFLYSAAMAEERYAQVSSELAHLSVGDVMTAHPPVVPAGTTVAHLVDDVLWHYRGDAVAVTDGNGWLAGVVTAQVVRSVPPARHYDTYLSQLAWPITALIVARPQQSMDELLAAMAGSPHRVAVVLDADNRLAGLVTPADIERATAFGHLRRPTPDG